LTTLYLYKDTYRGDLALGALTLGSALLTTAFKWSGAGLADALLRSNVFMASYIGTLVAVTIAYRLSPLHPLWGFPGPIANRLTALKLAHMVWGGKRYLVIKELHQKYGKFVRTG
jgi:hypothetical protein